MSVQVGNENPIQFGPQSLFGMYHEPAGETARGAVLLCAPLGQDQIRSHRLYRQLAHALAASGHAVLRYDGYGTGDSPGDSLDVDWPRCLVDAATAADELRRRSGCAHLIGFGARLGGSIALEAAEPARLGRLIAWDPVLDGAAHVARLDAWQRQLHTDPRRFARLRAPADAAGQWLGFAVSAALRAGIAALAPAPPRVPTLVLQSADTDAGPALARFAAAGVSFRRLATASPWTDFARLETTLLAPEVIRATCGHLLDRP